MSTPDGNTRRSIPDHPDGGRRSTLIVLIVIGLGIFALIAGWSGILNPPPKPTAEQLRQVQLQRQEVERQLYVAVRQTDGQKDPKAHTTPPPSAPFKLSTGNAKEKYGRAVNLPPNWATQECVDIIVRYPDAPEAALAADALIDKWDHILPRDFFTLTGQQLPVDYEMSRAEMVEILNAVFERRGIHPKK